ncbi:MAG: hypothetical protein A2Y76_11570 [Planctomycetes bacterium RBG_13_60_9]|nr:MAG: hypothetical protein A2Y76_11570 [Planctomycetes bacterium RBG_13_60_9]
MPATHGETICGYKHASYAGSLAEFGRPRALPRCGGWVLDRAIPGVSFRDATGCYPLFACRDWSQLEADLVDVAADLVCLYMVTDPFGEYDRALLDRCFGDRVIAFKEHFCIDLSKALNDLVCRHHRRYARKAFKLVNVERCRNPAFLEDWTRLYEHLIQRHGITGIAAFSRDAFARQLEVPGLVAFRASYRGTPVGMILWYIQGDVAYYHLGAYSPLGYETYCSFALFWHAIEHFMAGGLKWLNLGAGTRRDATDGLSRFKRGWSTGTRMAYFCGRIFDMGKYAEAVKASGIAATEYFPAYRMGEFG